MRKKKFKNTCWLPDHELESLARCLLPDIIAFYESEEGISEYKAWEREQAEKEEKKTSE